MQPTDDIAWAKKVNDRWIVRESLRRDATAYLDHLAAEDPERLIQACGRARLLIDRRESCEDPKPWFYAGLFSIATFAEGQRFLASHPFTLATLPTLADSPLGSLHEGNVAISTWEKIGRIRGVLAELGAG